MTRSARTLALAGFALLLFALPATANAATLRGIVGPGFEIRLLDETGAPVTQIAPGQHTIIVEDRSAEHNFHLTGPGGTDRRTAVEFVGTETWQVTLTAGVHTYLCDPHPTSMRGTFRVGDEQAPPPAPVRRLTATVGPGATISLRTASGARVRQLAHGTYRITVRDRSRTHNFKLTGPGVNRSTGVRFRGTVTWTVTLHPGTYRYVCTPHARRMRGSFRVT